MREDDVRISPNNHHCKLLEGEERKNQLEVVAENL
jgi:hypothetical protein